MLWLGQVCPAVATGVQYPIPSAYIDEMNYIASALPFGAVVSAHHLIDGTWVYWGTAVTPILGLILVGALFALGNHLKASRQAKRAGTGSAMDSAGTAVTARE